MSSAKILTSSGALSISCSFLTPSPPSSSPFFSTLSLLHLSLSPPFPFFLPPSPSLPFLVLFSILDLSLSTKETFSYCILEILKFPFHPPLLLHDTPSLVTPAVYFCFKHARVCSQECLVCFRGLVWASKHLTHPAADTVAALFSLSDIFLFPEESVFIRSWWLVKMYFRNGILFKSWAWTLLTLVGEQLCGLITPGKTGTTQN